MKISQSFCIVILFIFQNIYCQQNKETTISNEKHISISDELKKEMLNTLKPMVSEGLYCYPEIPRRAFKKCTKRMMIPENDILALCDTEIFGSGKKGLVIGTTGIYFKNDWTSALPGRFFISFSDFKNMKINKTILNEIQIGDFYFDNTSGDCSSEFIVSLLTNIQNKINIHSKVHVNNDTIQKYRYISLRPSEENKLFFNFHEKTDTNSILDFLEKTKNVRNQMDDYSHLGSWTELAINSSKRKYLKDYTFIVQSIQPIKNVYNEDSMIFIVDTIYTDNEHSKIQSIESYYAMVYLPPLKINIKNSEVTGFRIKEECIYSEINKDYTYIPIAIGVCKETKIGIEEEICWYELIKHQYDQYHFDSLDWYLALKNQNYKGQVYKTITIK